jgi:uncharacterized membrane protein
MNGAHIHLVLNHFPVIGLIFGILLLGTGLWRKSRDFVRAALLVTVLAGALTVPTYLSGEPAEDVIEGMPKFSEELVHEHESAALFALIFVSASGLAAALGLWLSIKNGDVPKKLSGGILLLMLFSLTVAARTNYLGGKISHPELDQATNPAAESSDSDND